MELKFFLFTFSIVLLSAFGGIETRRSTLYPLSQHGFRNGNYNATLPAIASNDSANPTQAFLPSSVSNQMWPEHQHRGHRHHPRLHHSVPQNHTRGAFDFARQPTRTCTIFSRLDPHLHYIKRNRTAGPYKYPTSRPEPSVLFPTTNSTSPRHHHHIHHHPSRHHFTQQNHTGISTNYTTDPSEALIPHLLVNGTQITDTRSNQTSHRYSYHPRYHQPREPVLNTTSSE